MKRKKKILMAGGMLALSMFTCLSLSKGVNAQTSNIQDSNNGIYIYSGNTKQDGNNFRPYIPSLSDHFNVYITASVHSLKGDYLVSNKYLNVSYGSSFDLCYAEYYIIGQNEYYDYVYLNYSNNSWYFTGEIDYYDYAHESDPDSQTYSTFGSNYLYLNSYTVIFEKISNIESQYNETLNSELIEKNNEIAELEEYIEKLQSDNKKDKTDNLVRLVSTLGATILFVGGIFVVVKFIRKKF